MTAFVLIPIWVVQTDKLEFDRERDCMKRAVIGGFLSLIGSIWALAIGLSQATILLPLGTLNLEDSGQL